MEDEMEPFNGKYDWDQAFAQNPDQPVFDVPNWARDRVHGTETAEDSQARATGQAASEWLEIAHLDPKIDMSGLDDNDDM